MRILAASSVHSANQLEERGMYARSMYVCMYVCMYICMYIFI